MVTITFRTVDAYGVYSSMIEGMEEVAQDDLYHLAGNSEGYAEAVAKVHGYSLLWAALAKLPPEFDGAQSVTLPREAVEIAEAVLENCKDNSERYYAMDDEESRERDLYLYDGDVVIRDPRADWDAIYQGAKVPHLGCQDAILQAMEAFETTHCVEGMPEELLPMMKTLEAIVIQMGCAGNSVWGTEERGISAREDWLTSVMDCVIFG